MSQPIYLEVDEDITSAIDKLLATSDETVSIVVPKRSTLLQSVVNLKLLKKSAHQASKELVLVTTDKTAINLAGRLGLAVADNLSNVPTAEVPESGPDEPEAGPDVVEGDASDLEGESDTAEPAPAPETAAPAVAAPLMKRRPLKESAPTGAEPGTHAGKSKVPDYNKLQKRVLWIAAGVAALIGLVVANFWLTRANVVLYAKGTKVPTEFNLTIDPNAKQSDKAKAILAGQKLELNKDLTATFTATGKKDVGTKAHGTITIKNCDDTSGHALPAGSVVSASGKNFMTDAAASIPAGSFSGGGSVCNSDTVNVGVTAAENGDSYNLAPTNYTSPALNANFRLSGNQMSGGTSKTVTVVTQADVDKAKNDAIAKDQDGAKKELEKKASDGYTPLAETFEQTIGGVTVTPAVGSEGSGGNLTIKISYTELAYNQSDYESLVRFQEAKQVGSQNQVYDDGIKVAKLTVGDKQTDGSRAVRFNTDAFAGQKLDTAKVAALLKGKKYGDAAGIASKLPGVERADVNIKPGWASRMPRFTSHIKVEIKVSNPK